MPFSRMYKQSQRENPASSHPLERQGFGSRLEVGRKPLKAGPRNLNFKPEPHVILPHTIAGELLSLQLCTLLALPAWLKFFPREVLPAWLKNLSPSLVRCHFGTEVAWELSCGPLTSLATNQYSAVAPTVFQAIKIRAALTFMSHFPYLKCLNHNQGLPLSSWPPPASAAGSCVSFLLLGQSHTCLSWREKRSEVAAILYLLLVSRAVRLVEMKETITDISRPRAKIQGWFPSLVSAQVKREIRKRDRRILSVLSSSRGCIPYSPLLPVTSLDSGPDVNLEGVHDSS